MVLSIIDCATRTRRFCVRFEEYSCDFVGQTNGFLAYVLWDGFQRQVKNRVHGEAQTRPLGDIALMLFQENRSQAFSQ